MSSKLAKHLTVAAQARLARWLTGDGRRARRRWRFELQRTVQRAPHRVHYFHRVDDPYCQLMVQVLPALLDRFAVELVPHVVASLQSAMYPAPERLAAFARQDAACLGELYELAFAAPAGAPDARVASALSRHLGRRAEEGDPRVFLADAVAGGRALWAGEGVALPSPGAGERRLGEDARTLERLGHYLTATLYYAGEWYWGLDRLDHLERRLNGLGLAHGAPEVRFDRSWQGVFTPRENGAGRGATLEAFVSLRSPYSYIGMLNAQRFCAVHGLTLLAKPVLPMVTRGLAVPRAKRLYILADAKREATRAGLPFGYVADPLGAGVERVLAVTHRLAPERRNDFLAGAMRAVMAEGVDVATDRGLRRVSEGAGLGPGEVGAAVADDSWQVWVEKHRKELTNLGLWGVPCFRLGSTLTWGQDRFWRLAKALGESTAGT